MKSYDFKTSEQDILQFWEEQKIYQKIKKRNHGQKKFYFLQGPPYTSGRLHTGHAWNHSLKDAILRFKRMNGFDAWDRGGFDMHGLPTENKVQQQHDLKTKKDIVQFGMEKFIKECIKFSEEKAELMNQDLWKMGVWMNHENAYMPIHNSFIEGEWFLIKKVEEKNRLYRGNKVMTWCKSCETALSKHELEYKTVEDLSIFVKLKVTGSENDFLIIWTTTPWTIPFNLAVMVNPELNYIKAKVDVGHNKSENWIVSTALSTAFIAGVAGKSFEIIEEFTGEKLLGLSYEHPFKKYITEYSELKKQHKNVHTVILSEEYVDTSAGTGLVHCAPGCGPEDFEVGKSYNIPPLNTIDELGVFPLSMNKFAGLTAKDDDKSFIDILREENALIETSYVEHEYAHCSRCHSPVVFRLTEQWFFKTEDLRDKMLGFNKDINWVPETAKNAFDSWLKNLRDNSITKQRFWGTPVPIWVCEHESCNKYEVIGSINELKEKSITPVPNNLHKPWIDSVKLQCSCGAEMTRIPDVLDVWIDAGTVSWNCLDYPQNSELFDKYFPADFIVEGKDQIRGWYNLLMVASTLAFDRPSFKNVCMHGFLTDVEGQKMSKSLGNIISPYEIIDKYGADTLRYYMSGTTAGEDINFSWDEVALKHKNLIILWNLHNFLIDYMSTSGVALKNNILLKDLDKEERYILSRLHSTLKQVTLAMNSYKIYLVPSLIESLYLDISRTYIQLIREKSVTGTEKEKEAILYTLFQTITTTIKMFSLIVPFISERMYQNLKEIKDFGFENESVHECTWSNYDESLIDDAIISDIAIAQEIIQAGLFCRDKINYGVRWPISECIIDTSDESVRKSIYSITDLLKKQLNVKIIKLEPKVLELKIKPNYKTLGKDFGNDTHRVIDLINLNSTKLIERMKSNKSLIVEGFEITSNHVLIEKICPEGFEMSDIRGGTLFINKVITPELESEGFSREVTRRVQQLRKDNALNKRDVIDLVIVSQIDLSPYDQTIREKVGAKNILFLENKASIEGSENNYSASSKEKIKGKDFEIYFNKL